MSPIRSIPALCAALLGACLLPLLAPPGAAAASDPGYPFELYATYPTPNLDLQAGDLNGDGAADLVTYRGHDTQVRLGDGEAGLAPAVTLSGPEVRALELVDLDGDDVLDIVTADPVRTLLGDGAGGFTPAADSPAAGERLAVGDFTGDAAPDLVVLDDMTLTLLPGLGDGGLGSPVDVPVTLPPPDSGYKVQMQALAAGDVDEDSNLDLVVVAYDDAIRYAEPLIELFGDGAGGFTQAAGPDEIVRGATSLTFADLDADGHGDLLSTDTNVSQGGTADLVYGDGRGGFERGTGFFHHGGATRPAVEDFNGDGLLDTAAHVRSGYGAGPRLYGGIHLTLGSAGRDSSPAISQGVPTTAVSGLEAADFGGDALPDLAQIASGPDRGIGLEVHLNVGPTGNPEPRPLPSPPAGPSLGFALDPDSASFRGFLRKGVGVRPGCAPVDCSVRLVVRPRGRAAERLGPKPIATRVFELGERRPARVFVRPGRAIRRKLRRSGPERLLVRAAAFAGFEGSGGGERMTAARNLRIGS